MFLRPTLHELVALSQRSINLLLLRELSSVFTPLLFPQQAMSLYNGLCAVVLYTQFCLPVFLSCAPVVSFQCLPL